MLSEPSLELMIVEMIDVRARGAEGSLSRRLAELCLELCFQEIVANDERFEPVPDSAIEELDELFGTAPSLARDLTSADWR